MRKKQILKLALIVLGVAVIGLLTTVFIRTSGQGRNSAQIRSEKSSKKDRASSKSTKNTKKNRAKTNSQEKQSSSARDNDQPNAGKVLKFDSIEAAQEAIDQHASTCPYGRGRLYSGAVYTGSYQCKCGLKIIWWDKAAKESVNRDMESFSNQGIDTPGYNYDVSDPQPNISTPNNTQSSNVENQ